jgi:hypothetical protein
MKVLQDADVQLVDCMMQISEMANEKELKKERTWRAQECRPSSG